MNETMPGSGIRLVNNHEPEGNETGFGSAPG